MRPLSKAFPLQGNPVARTPFYMRSLTRLLVLYDYTISIRTFASYNARCIVEEMVLGEHAVVNWFLFFRQSSCEHVKHFNHTNFIVSIIAINVIITTSTLKSQYMHIRHFINVNISNKTRYEFNFISKKRVKY